MQISKGVAEPTQHLQISLFILYSIKYFNTTIYTNHYFSNIWYTQMLFKWTGKSPCLHMKLGITLISNFAFAYLLYGKKIHLVQIDNWSIHQTGTTPSKLHYFKKTVLFLKTVGYSTAAACQVK